MPLITCCGIIWPHTIPSGARFILLLSSIFLLSHTCSNTGTAAAAACSNINNVHYISDGQNLLSRPYPFWKVSDSWCAVARPEVIKEMVKSRRNEKSLYECKILQTFNPLISSNIWCAQCSLLTSVQTLPTWKIYCYYFINTWVWRLSVRLVRKRRRNNWCRWHRNLYVLSVACRVLALIRTPSSS